MNAPRAKKQTGFGLIEIMAAVLVLSLAFLALGALAARSLSSNNSAMSRSVATVAMYAIQDAMRADRASAMNGDYNNGGAPIAANDCPADTGSLASAQLHQWCDQQLGDAMLGGKVKTTTGAIACAQDGTCTVTITWDDSRGGPSLSGDDSATQTITTRGML
jgi:type IV pilus assembly protein PilV